MSGNWAWEQAVRDFFDLPASGVAYSYLIM